MPRALVRTLALAALALCLPASRAAAQCIPEWTAGFGGTGMGGPVYAQAVYDDGTGDAVYAGGLFTKAGGVTANNIARWDGTVWAPVGSGLATGSVLAIAPFDADGPGPTQAVLCAGGAFTGFVSTWDGAAWKAIPGGPDGVVRAAAVYDDGSGPALYIGGDFLNTGGNATLHIARWDGQSWSGLSSGINGNVYSLAVYDDGLGPALYAGGLFTQAGGNAANRIARWNGLAWSSLGSGTSGAVTALAVYDDGSGEGLYAGGLFNTAGGNSCSRIARWDGAAWSALKGGVSDIVYSLGVHNDGTGPALYAGGQFTQADNKPAAHIARWQGPAKGWSALGAGADNNVLAIAGFEDAHGPALIAAGDFVNAGNGKVSYIGQWRQGAWSGLGAALDETVFALRSFDDGAGAQIYAGGNFLNAGGVSVTRVARWNGAFWSPLGSGLNNVAHAMEVFDDGSGAALYLGGEFTVAGGKSASRVAQWDGADWSLLGTGVNGVVWALHSFNDGAGDALYAGGLFSFAGGNSAACIARWNGLEWSPLGAGVNQQVNALATFDDGGGAALFVAGIFSTAGGQSASRIAKWNGLAWSKLGTGLNNTANTLATFDDGSGPALYAAGQFTSAGGKAVSNIARWNGLEWSSLGTGLNGTVRALTVHDDGSGPALYAAGEFTQAGGQAANHVAKWDGLAWSSLKGNGNSNGVNGVGYALASLPEGDTQSALLVGGQFVTAGGIPSSNIARWGCPSDPADLCELALLAAPGSQSGDYLGQSVAISGDTLIVGAFGDNTAGNDAGAAHIFTRSGGGVWLFGQTLIPDDLIAGDFFGASAAVDGSFAIIGASRSDPAGANSGAAYVYRFSNGLWVPDGKLVADDAAQGDQFGISVAILDEIAFVGSWRADLPGKANAGAAYIFAREQGAWVQKEKLTADVPSAEDLLGSAVALSDQFAIAGAPGDDTAQGIDAGAAHVFFRVGDQWGNWETIAPADGDDGDGFGFSVAGEGSRLVVGAPGSDSLGADAGLAYVYRTSGGVWKAEDTLFPTGIKPGDALGTAVAIRGPLALVGGYNSDRQGTDSGAVSLFERDGDNWFETAKLTGKTIKAGDFLGASVAIGPSELAAGAIHAEAPGGDDQGAVLIYSTEGCPCYPDFTGDGKLDLFDFLGYVNSFNAGQPGADCTGDGVLDLFDFLCFVNSYNLGCGG